MSRIGKQPIAVPSGVDVKIDGAAVTVKGPKGQLARAFDPEMSIDRVDGELRVNRPSDEQRHRALHGLTRALLANMVTGVTDGFQRTLELVGTGYRAEEEGKALVLSLGFSHPIRIAVPAGLTCVVEDRGKRLVVSGCDKEQVGQFAVDIRRMRPPEPYKGKGVRYLGEYVRLKQGKTGKGKGKK